MRKAVIDVGSNSVLLVIAEHRDGAWRTLDERTQVTALGDQTKVTGLLSEAAMGRTLAALAEFFAVARATDAPCIAGATMAARIATNTPEFLARCAAQGTPVQVVSAQAEAQLGLFAVVDDPLFASAERVTIIDPGGHSTEICTIDRVRGQVELRKSVAVGALGIRDEFAPGGVADGPTMMAMSATIDREIGMEYRPHTCGTVVTLGATGTNLVSIREKLTSWQPDRVHGQILDYEEVSKAAGWLGPMTDAERAQVPGIEPGRERTLHIGALILERFLWACHGLDCAVSVRGWRYAALDHGLVLADELQRS
ncbi:MAG: hypothetical protein JNJ45_02485 [Chthonomonas sp.]|nr:hypothetical protein [Chthonomonas sp.]